MPESTVKERIISFIKHNSLSQKKFEELLGLSNGYVNNIRKGISDNVLFKICDRFPTLNRDWLLYGEGEMLRKLPDGTATKIGAENSVVVRFFEVTPSATFQEFCSGAPDAANTISIPCPPDEAIDESSCVFQIYGESMEPQIQSGARILCQEIAPSRWHQIPPSVVVIAYADRFVIKRITENHLSDQNFLILASDNPKFPEREQVQLADIRTIFRARRIIDQIIL